MRPLRPVLPILAVAFFFAVLTPLASQAAVTIEWVQVGEPGNACDVQPQGCFGAVDHEYAIAKYQVTNSQYVEMLNAVAVDDPNDLYDTQMDLSSVGGIIRSGSPGSYSYSVKAGFADKPVNWINFYDTQRFANWMHNGQPSGAQDATTTEDGAYTFPGEVGVGPVRNPGAAFFVPNLDEWFKAAYYHPVAQLYYDYPAGSDTETVCAVPSATPNTGNCDNAVAALTDVGSYPGSPAPFGTFDQSGNLQEWTETGSAPLQRNIRGAAYLLTPNFNAASIFTVSPDSLSSFFIGLRLAGNPLADPADRIYDEQFVGESVFPTSPELDLFGLGGIVSDATLNGTHLQFAVVDQSLPSTAFASGTVVDGGSGGLFRATFDSASVAGQSASLTIVARYGADLIGAGLTSGAAGLSVGVELFGGGVNSTVLSGAMASALASGSPFALDLAVDLEGGEVTGIIDVAGGGTVATEPLAVSLTASGFDVAGALASAPLGSAVNADMSRFEIYRQFVASVPALSPIAQWGLLAMILVAGPAAASRTTRRNVV